jgi:methylmalonyl-CoA mutase N-terminal domain/subunit
MKIDDFAPRLSFFFNAHNDFFEEIAKYRAARVLWAEIARNKYGAQKETSWKMRFHAQTAGCSLQDKQPEVNLIRVAYQALAAVLGGCQSLHTNSMDETLALPSEHAVTLALRGKCKKVERPNHQRESHRPPRPRQRDAGTKQHSCPIP